jgi:Ca2+/Na+ antiporter
MGKEILKYLQEWAGAVPGRLYILLVVLIPLIGGTVAIFIWLLTHGLDWWWAVLYLVAVFAFIVLSFWAFYRVAKQRDELEKQVGLDQTDNETQRKLLIRLRDTDVKHIPDTLQGIYRQTKSLVDSVITDDSKYLEAFHSIADLFDLYKIPLNRDKYLNNKVTNEEVEKACNKLFKALGIKYIKDSYKKQNKHNYLANRRLIELLQNLLTVFDNRKIGILAIANENDEYNILSEALEHQTQKISLTKLAEAITTYELFSQYYANFLLLMRYTQPERQNYKNAKYAVDYLQVKNLVDIEMRHYLSTVNIYIERYLTGKPNDL